MKSKFFGFSAKLALFLVAACGMLTSCYEKEEITTTIDTSVKKVNYVISGSIANSTNLKGIQGATITVTGPAAAGTKSTTTDEKGIFSISYEFASDKVKANDVSGSYVVDVIADGYNDRSTKVELQFSAFENQTVSTHLDFLMKSKAIQGVAEEIVAGATEQTLTIEGASADGSGTVADEVKIPAGAFGKDADGNYIVKTITLMRAPAIDETAVSAVRIYEGKPDGTKFVLPLEITFTYPDALVGDEGLFVLYQDADGNWYNDETGKIERVSANTYKASVYHFSKFMFGQKPTSESGTSTSHVKTSVVTKLAAIGTNKYHNSQNVAKTFDITIKGVKVGSKYQTKLDVVFEGITDAAAKKVAIYQTQQYIDKTIGKNTPADAFKEIDVVEPITVAAHSDLLYVTPTRTANEWTFTTSFAGKTYTIKVDEYLTYTYVPTVEDYTHGHGIGHGHGHGDDLNAGGGIITFE